MYQINLNPGLSLELSVEARIKGQRPGLSDLTDEELKNLCIEGLGKWKKWEGDPMWDLIGLKDQSNEVYRAIAASRILVKRYGEDYVRNLIK